MSQMPLQFLIDIRFQVVSSFELHSEIFWKKAAIEKNVKYLFLTESGEISD